MPESSIEILNHSVGGVTYRHDAHRDTLAFKAIMNLASVYKAQSIVVKLLQDEVRMLEQSEFS